MFEMFPLPWIHICAVGSWPVTASASRDRRLLPPDKLKVIMLISLSLSLLLCLSLYLNLYFDLDLDLCIYVSMCLCVNVSMYLCIYVSMYLSVCLSVCLSIPPPFHASINFIYTLWIHVRPICGRHLLERWGQGHPLPSSIFWCRMGI